MNTLFRFSVSFLVLMTICDFGFGEPKESLAKVYIVRDGTNKVIEAPWSPSFSLLDAVGWMGGTVRKLNVHLWRHNDRRRMNLPHKGLKQLATTRFQPDDVIIFGDLNEERAKKLEKMEVISRVLKLDSHSPPPEIDKPVQF